MYKQKYQKYKSKYLKLKSGMTGGLGVQEIDMSDATKNIVNIDILVDGDDSQPSQDIPRKDLPTIEDDDVIIKLEQEEKQENQRPIELGTSGITGKVVSKDKLDDIIGKIKQIDSIDDFDKFTDKYMDNEKINWSKVKSKYAGIYINPSIKDVRYELMPDGTNTRTSWWKTDFMDYVADDKAVIFN